MSLFPYDPDYDFGDCHHIAVIPALSPDASQDNTNDTTTVTGDAVHQEPTI